MFLCEQNCTYNGYNNKTASCECGVKLQQIVISEIVDENNVVTYNFTNKNDMITMKCYQTLFSKDGLIKNIGNYIMLFIVLLIMSSSILFYKCGYYFLEEKINEIINKKEKINNKISKCETIDIQQNKIKQNDKKNKKDKKKSGKNLRIKQTKSVKKIKSKNKIDVSNSNSFSKLDINTKSSSKNDKEKKKNQFNKSLDNLGLNENNIDFYNDFDLNSFTYNEAKKYDKRKFVSFYISLLKAKHPISFSFLPIDDYNSLIIKIDLFFISLSLYYFINSLFFDQSIIHKIYKDAGIYNLKYLIPYIIYSCIISHTLYVITKYIFLSERNLHEIAVEKNFEKATSIAYQAKRRLSIKYICFFVVFTVIDTFIWYYLSSFGAVYQNTQVFIIENTMISIGFSLVFPFVYYLLPSILRINSLKRKDGELLYKISKVTQFI